jgi:uncharacterized protein
MAKSKRPTIGHGKICYLEIPSADISVSSTFYSKVFGWQIRKRSDGELAFDDSVGEVSGTWVIARSPSTITGTLVYIMVDNIESTVKSVVNNGGRIVQSIGKDAPELTARFSDPAGNIFGLYQEPVK